MSNIDHEPFVYVLNANSKPEDRKEIKLSELTSEVVHAMEPRQRMEIIEALNAHIIAKGGQNVISPDEQRGALYLIRAQRVQGVRNNPRASKAAKDAVSAPPASLDDFA